MYSKVIDSLKFETPWKEIDDQDKVMSCQLLQNKLHLHQAFNTPLALGLLKDYIRKHSMGKGAREILDGNFDPNVEGNLPAVNHCLRHYLRQLALLNSICVNLILDEYKQAMKIQYESTSSSPSGRHYGSYKAALTDDIICMVHAIMMARDAFFLFYV
eukprot:14594047-Ditylum_brightwellii.AAC.1